MKPWRREQFLVPAGTRTNDLFPERVLVTKPTTLLQFAWLLFNQLYAFQNMVGVSHPGSLTLPSVKKWHNHLQLSLTRTVPYAALAS